MTDDKKAAEKKKRDLLLAGVLLVIFAFSFTKNVLMYKKGKIFIKVNPPAASGGPGGEGQAMADQLVYVTNLRQYDAMRDVQRAVWDKEWGRDPFTAQASLSSSVKAVNLTLQGVLWDEKNPKAVVNEKTLVVGDTVYGYTVVGISPRSVTLKTGEKTIELSVFRPMFGGEAGN